MPKQRTQETLLRYWTILKLLPRFPNGISLNQLKIRLEHQQFSVGIRTLERDVQTLRELFPQIGIVEKGRPPLWGWCQAVPQLHIFNLSQDEALSFKLIETYLKPILPNSTLNSLTPYLAAADQLLRHAERPQKWLSKVRVLPAQLNFVPPHIDPEVQRIVYDALLDEKCLEIQYKKPDSAEIKTWQIEPVALIQRGQILYILGSIYPYFDIVHLGLHRIQQAQKLDRNVQNVQFDLDHYLAKNGFNFAQTTEQEAIHLRFYERAGRYLKDTPLSVDQVILECDAQTFEVKATVWINEPFRWWILGFGANVEVLSPPWFRQQIANQLQIACLRYNRN